jgi:hypothetical protein
MPFPPELWHLEANDLVMIEWFSHIIDEHAGKPFIPEVARIIERDGPHTILRDMNGQAFKTIEFDTIKQVRELTPAEKVAFRMDILETYVT